MLTMIAILMALTLEPAQPEAEEPRRPLRDFVLGRDEPGLTRDVLYAQREGSPDRFTSLDIHEPAAGDPASGPRPILIFVHGGGWANGDKRGVNMLPGWCEKNGWVLVSLNYRLSPAVQHPEHARDVAAGVAWVIGHAEEFGGDAGRIVLMGHSAGAHLAAVVGSNPNLLAAHARTPADLAGVLLLDGAGYDIATQKESPRLPERVTTMYEQAFGDDPEILADASPIRWAGEGETRLPPVLMVHAGRRIDSRVEGQRLADAWKDRAEKAEVHHAADKNHATVNRTLGTAGDADTEAVEKFIVWSFTNAARDEPAETAPSVPAPAQEAREPAGG